MKIIFTECESGRYLAWYEDRDDIIANGDTKKEVEKNLIEIYKSVMEYEQKFDAKVFYQIMAYCYEQKWEIGKVVHVGNNHFEMEITYSNAPMAGRGGIATYTVKDGEVFLVKSKTTWMS